ncbi:A/G-specific adenine glycosylase [Muriicola soli]|uniref:Adenine DNA glycosylase n=1 Tax=Muriicola soli TaxID=2507538 RepID=A0A411EC86_9FLAO|nr:A/G-specific adenine glycosylase [Muriicola soli]QBA65154.1 A/G-specific adenine glycosylase [Muriicola soli]
MSNFSKTLLDWYSKNKRELPWRETKDPYSIWLSEIILQQTRIAQGLPYYKKFISHYPSVFELAEADEQEILRLWQGLGYYSRARNMHAAAKTIVRDYKGKFPQSYDEIIKLKGIGDYTASAIASICFGEPTAVVDGNVYRVLARNFGIDLPINSTDGIKYFKKLATEVKDESRIADYNQAIMEFGALQCKPKSPDCPGCPLNTGCIAFEENRVSKLPVKLKKGKVKIRHFNYLVFLDNKGNTLLNKRLGKGIWQHLYEFPMIETDRLLEPDEVYASLAQENKNPKDIVLWQEEPVVHKLSHQHLVTRFLIVEMEEQFDEGIPMENVEDYPTPVLVSEFLDTFKNSYF